MIENGMVDYQERAYKPYCCPVCGEECETIYRDAWGNICGCDNCVEVLDAGEVLDE